MNSLHTQKDSTVQKEPVMTSKSHASPAQASVDAVSTGMRMTATATAACSAGRCAHQDRNLIQDTHANVSGKLILTCSLLTIWARHVALVEQVTAARPMMTASLPCSVLKMSALSSSSQTAMAKSVIVAQQVMTASLPCSVLKTSALSLSSQQVVGDESKSHRKTTLPCSMLMK